MKQIIENLDKSNNVDKIRLKPRIEISAAITLASEDLRLIQKHAKIILREQQTDGYWLEYAYRKEDLPAGYYGAVPTSFCILGLVRASKMLNKPELLVAAVKGANYLSDKEKSGYFFKAENNKSDVINTNLLAGTALIELANALPKNSPTAIVYRGACARAIKRSIASQHWNGAFPYISYGVTVPFLYHSMTLALLTYLKKYFDDSLLGFSIKKGLNFLNKYTDIKGNVNWKKEKYHDKSGACWTYAWNKTIFFNTSKQALEIATTKQLERLTKTDLFCTSFDKMIPDVFYSSWCVSASYFKYKSKISATIVGFSRWVLRIPLHKKFKTYYKLFLRKIFSFGLDKGPIEYW